MLLFQDLAGVETKSLREAKNDDNQKIALFAGIASTADKDLTDDIIEAGAFGEVNAEDIRLFRDHDPRQVIGKWHKFEQKGKRLEVEGEIGLDIDKGLETYKLMKHGYIKGLSVGFRPKRGGVKWDEENDIRYIKSATLLEISIVSIPANPGARIHAVKSLSPENTRQWLFDGGLAEDEVDIVMARGFEALLKTKRINITEIDGYRAHDDAAFTALANEAKRFAELLR